MEQLNNANYSSKLFIRLLHTDLDDMVANYEPSY
jgi:hypothetical protein